MARITIFEHGQLEVGHTYAGVQFTQGHYDALGKFHRQQAEKNGKTDYFSLLFGAVKFAQYVGVLQVGELTIEVLPKADQDTGEGSEANYWRNQLLQMLRAVGTLPVQAPSFSSLHVQQYDILELYFELFVKEVDALMRLGLIKQYRQQSCNTKALKGALLFGQHLQQNLVHQERFYTHHTVYDQQHLMHEILFEALILLQRLCKGHALQGRIARLLLDFPPQQRIKINEGTFSKLSFGRKQAPYQQAIHIAKLLLLNYHPDVVSGQEDVLALLFDMNALWERFVFVNLQQNPDWEVREQVTKLFWKGGNNSSDMKADIVCRHRHSQRVVVLDTKWKNINGNAPSPEDLRQMYVYADYYGASRVALVYPGKEDNRVYGKFQKLCDGQEEKVCEVVQIAPKVALNQWGKTIAKLLFFETAPYGI
ncbi:McrC family protein [Persicobacter diffluens]|uniref:Restriction endonuclease n=1 Tax=Persicobacter diffluens TaxID=981 RepID=A0AAN5AJT2_9BACT|nr:hypothetical protein PEDI_17340 [Persicobacter diffluens]